MTVRYVPMRSDVVCELLDPKLTKAGLEIAGTYEESWPRCRVLALGGMPVYPNGMSTEIQVGDVVLADASMGRNIKQRIAVFPFDAIICKVDGHSDDDVIEVEPSPIVAPNRAQRRAAQATRRH